MSMALNDEFNIIGYYIRATKIFARAGAKVCVRECRQAAGLAVAPVYSTSSPEYSPLLLFGTAATQALMKT